MANKTTAIPHLFTVREAAGYLRPRPCCASIQAPRPAASSDILIRSENDLAHFGYGWVGQMS
jgi:hypothetical protein